MSDLDKERETTPYQLRAFFPEKTNLPAIIARRAADEIERHEKRLAILQIAQRVMREPERTMVCDILANGRLLPDPRGKRYGGRDVQLGSLCAHMRASCTHEPTDTPETDAEWANCSADGEICERRKGG